jgi:hypothetical protein
MMMVMLALLVAGVVFGQGQPQFMLSSSPYLNVSLTNSDTATVYVLFPDNGGTWYLSESLPTKYYSGTVRRPLNWWSSGDAYLFVEPNASTGMAAGETDSLSLNIRPLVWDEYDQEFAEVADTTWLVLGQNGTYKATSIDYVDWDTGAEYGCLLTGELWPVSGFVIGIRQMDADTGIGIYTLSLFLSRTVR